MPLFTLDELRSLIATEATDDALTALLAEAEAEIARVGGLIGTVTYPMTGGSSVLILPRYVASVTSIGHRYYSADTDETLDPSAYVLLPDRRSIRMADGTRFRPLVTVVAETLDALTIGRALALQLVRLYLTNQPGVLGFTEGNWTIQFKNGESYTLTRDALLGSLAAPWSFA